MTTHPHPLAGAVKPLEWRDYSDDEGYVAFGTGNEYTVTFEEGAWGWMNHTTGEFDIVDGGAEAAKAAAQADYTARILSALSSPTPPADVAGAVKMLNEQDREYNRKTNALIARHAEQVAALSARVAELEGDRGWQTVAESNQQMAQSWQASRRGSPCRRHPRDEGEAMKLSFDITRCAKTNDNWDCPLARHCLRRIDKGRDEYQPYTAFKGGVGCDGFINAHPER